MSEFDIDVAPESLIELPRFRCVSDGFLMSRFGGYDIDGNLSRMSNLNFLRNRSIGKFIIIVKCPLRSQHKLQVKCIPQCFNLVTTIE